MKLRLTDPGFKNGHDTSRGKIIGKVVDNNGKTTSNKQVINRNAVANEAVVNQMN